MTWITAKLKFKFGILIIYFLRLVKNIDEQIKKGLKKYESDDFDLFIFWTILESLVILWNVQSGLKLFETLIQIDNILKFLSEK